MISFYEALEIIKTFALPLGTERVNLFHSFQRTLAENIYSDISMPPFNKSAMDGYACRKSDLKNPLLVIEEIAAGTIPIMPIGENQCARIMTGAMVPEGSDFVIMKEDTVGISPDYMQCINEVSKNNICYEGEDIKAGNQVLKMGDLLLPAHIAILASVGCTNPLVYLKPSVAIISTGNELVEPNEIPGLSKIRNSNSYQLAAQVQQLGLTPDYLGIAADDEDYLKNIVNLALTKFKVTIISGGVSVGDFDFVPKILTQLKVNIQVHGMDVKPGKHLLFGERGNCFVFGLPGNPVSSFVQFELLVKPFLNALMGNTREETFLYMPLEEEYILKKKNQLTFVPVVLTKQGTALPLEYHGSAHINAYTSARGIMEIPKGILKLNKGEIVCVRPL